MQSFLGSSWRQMIRSTYNLSHFPRTGSLSRSVPSPMTHHVLIRQWGTLKTTNPICADDARVACPLFQAEYGGPKPTSALQLHFSKVSESTFRSLNGQWHSRLPKIGNSHFRVCYQATHNNVVYAVAAWSNPVARMLPQTEWMELRRFAIAPDAPRFTASRMLGWMRRDIVERFPGIVRL